MKEVMKFVKNVKTGVVFPLTRVLEKMRKDLIPCTKEGHAIMRDNVDMPNLYNPFSDVIIQNTEENARIQGLIPCRDEEHAAKIKAALMGMGGDASKQTQGLQEPPAKPAIVVPDLNVNNEPPAEPDSPTKNVTEQPIDAVDPTDVVDTTFIEMLRSTKVEAMDKDACKAFAFEHFGEKLSKTNSEATLQEKVQVMINAKLSETAEAA